jgi:hypothetical protein
MQPKTQALSTLKIPLRDRDGNVRAYALVSPEDYERVMIRRWYLGSLGYVMSAHNRNEERIYLHRYVLGLKKGDKQQCDHISGDRLDNRRSNLRFATASQNGQNSNGWSRSSSAYRGVSWNVRQQKWQAYATINRVQHYLGVFADELEAASVAAEFRAENMPFSQEYKERYGANDD